MSEEIIPKKELSDVLHRCPEWEIESDGIVRSYEFESFVDAIDFVNVVADIAETAFHHPEIWIRYNKVKLILSTHEIGGVTEADVVMASRIDTVTDE